MTEKVCCAGYGNKKACDTGYPDRKDDNNPAISIIMSVYNNSSTVGKSMDSIIAQTFTDWEMIVCDDGSIDDSYIILNEYAKKDCRIKVIRNIKNRGLAYSLNHAISVSRSNILARQDADDYSAPNRLEVQYRFVMENPIYAIVGTGWYNIESTGMIKKALAKEKPNARDLIPDGGFMHPTWMMRKDAVEKVGFYTVRKETMRSQDYHLMLKLYGAGYISYNIQEPLYYYTADSNTFKRSRNLKRVKGLMWIRWDGYRRNKFPFWAYGYVLKPLLVNLIPRSLMHKHYRRRYYGK